MQCVVAVHSCQGETLVFAIPEIFLSEPLLPSSFEAILRTICVGFEVVVVLAQPTIFRSRQIPLGIQRLLHAHIVRPNIGAQLGNQRVLAKDVKVKVLYGFSDILHSSTSPGSNEI